ncbi:MAG: hypothetical protein ACJASB_002684 [Shewanella psychromarinicola]|jgi:hypothetical protein
MIILIDSFVLIVRPNRHSMSKITFKQLKSLAYNNGMIIASYRYIVINIDS